MTPKTLKATLLTGTLLGVTGLTAAPAPAVAQDGDRVVVTGSRIVRDEFTASAPITVVDATEIVESGAVGVDELLKDLPAFTGFQLGVSTNNGNNGLRAVDLRGLGLNRNLVLVNGRRTVTSFIGGSSEIGAVDLNTIPLAMVERIEVLKDGASTIYGSDALAGVVNIILKDDFNGLDVAYDYGAATDNWDAVNQSVSAVIGTSTSEGGIVASLEWTKQEEMLQGDRDWALFDLYPFCTAPGDCEAQEGGSSNSRKIVLPSTTAQAQAGGESTFILDNGAARPFESTDVYNYAPVNALVTPNERWQAAFNANYDILDDTFLGDIEGFFEGTYTRRFSHQRLAPDASFAVNPAVETPNYGLQYNDWVPAANPANPFGVNPRNPYGISGEPVRINRRFEESGGRLFTQSVDTFRLLGGIRGEMDMANIGWELYYTYAENEDTSETKNYGRFDRWATMVDPAACGAVQACVDATGGQGYLDPFGEFGTIPDAAFDYLFAGSLKDIYRNYLTVVGANVNGDLMQMSGGTAGWAFGYEHRDESARYIPDEFVSEGLTTGGAGDPLRGGFYVDEVYGELLLPVLPAVTLSGSVRYSDYNTVGSTTNFRAGVEWDVTDDLFLRGVYSTGFRAPNVVELFSGDQSGFPLVEDYCEFYEARTDITDQIRTNCAAAGVPTGHQLGFAWQSLYTQLAPASLEPEESENFSAGAVYEPSFLDGLQLSADYWNIEIDGYISAIPINYLLYSCLDAADQSASQACSYFFGADSTPGNGDATGRLGGTGGLAIYPDDAQAPIGNLGVIETDGVDFEVRYATAVDWGFITGMDASVSGTWTNSFQETFPIVGSRERVGTIDSDGSHPEWRINTDLGVSGSNWDLAWQMRYIDGMDDFYRPPELTDDARAESILYHDIVGSISYGRYTLLAGINNLTNETPPFFHSAFNAETEPGTYDVIGRRFFARISASF